MDERFIYIEYKPLLFVMELFSDEGVSCFPPTLSTLVLLKSQEPSIMVY